MAFNNYLEDEKDKPYFTTNSLAYYYDKMEGFAKAVEGSAKALNLTKEEVEKRITLYIEQNKNELDQRFTQNKNEMDQRLADWDGKLETFDSSVEKLLTEWVDDGTLTHVIDSKLIDQKIAPVAAQLVDTAKQTDMSRVLTKSGYIRHGLLSYPSEFTHPGVNIYRDINGKVQHDFNTEKYRTGEKEIFYSSTGVDTTGDGTRLKPYRSPIYALEKAIEATETKIVIKALTVVTDYIGFVRETARTVIPVGKTISIIPDNEENKIRFINGRNRENLTWVADSGIHKTARSVTNNVVDFKRLDAYGVAIPYEKKATLADCMASPYSWYTDATSVWVNRNGQAVDDDLWLLLEGKSFWAGIKGATLFIENIEFYQSSSSTPACDILGDMNSVFINKNCLFFGGKLFDPNIAIGNGLGIEGVGKTYSFDSIAAHTATDGFNYHYITIPASDRKKCIVFEYNCKGYQNGVRRTQSNNNASTGHEGCTIFRVNTIGFESNGPVIADVNGCNVYCIDCHARKSLINNLSNGGSAAFFFDNTSATSPGIAYLENCSGGGLNTYAISSDTTFDIKLLGFEGTRILNGVFAKVSAVEDIF